jgi:hypothetical protein
VTVSLLLTGGFTLTPTRAAVTDAAKVPPVHTVQLDRPMQSATLASCLAGVNNSYEFYTWCKGSSPTSFRDIAYCADGMAVLGIEYADGSGSLSYADCQIDGQNNTLAVNWGILLCSNSNGAGTFQGYYDRSGDISGLLLNWGNGTIATGGTTLCEYSTANAVVINPNQAP